MNKEKLKKIKSEKAWVKLERDLQEKNLIRKNPVFKMDTAADCIERIRNAEKVKKEFSFCCVN